MALALDKVVEQFEDALPVLVVLGVVARLMVLVLEVVVVIGVRLPRHIFMRGRDRRLAIHVGVSRFHSDLLEHAQEPTCSNFEASWSQILFL